MLNESDLQAVVELAQRRARQGVPLDEVIGAYHIGDQALWNQIRTAAVGSDAELSSIATHIMESIHSISTALSAAHNEVTRLQQSHRITVSQRLIELLVMTDETSESLRLAETLGFDLELDFTAVAWAELASPEPTLHRVEQQLSRRRGCVAAGYVMGRAVVLSQGSPADLLAGQISRAVQVRMGVGTTRKGLRGAALTIDDAILALGASHPEPERRVAHYREVWLLATMLSRQAHLEVLYAGAVDVAIGKPHLADAIYAYTANQLSMASTGIALNVHPNTVKYRLERWSELTGLATRTVEGLALSLVACHLARAPREEQ